MRKRFWVELAASALSVLLFIGTALWPDWIERGFDVDPDGGDSGAEWLAVAISATFTVVSFAVVRKEWRLEHGRRVVPNGTTGV